MKFFVFISFLSFIISFNIKNKIKFSEIDETSDPTALYTPFNCKINLINYGLKSLVSVPMTDNVYFLYNSLQSNYKNTIYTWNSFSITDPTTPIGTFPTSLVLVILFLFLFFFFLLLLFFISLLSLLFILDSH